jgi:hypothetical protein
VLSIFGYTTGTIINGTADVVSNTAKIGIDIMDGTAHSVGNLLRNSSNVNGDLPIQMELNQNLAGIGPIYVAPEIPVPPTPLPTLDVVLNTSPVLENIPAENNTSNSIQGTIASSVASGNPSWCLIGEMNGRRGCINVNDKSMCTSGQTYDNQADCLKLQSQTSQLYMQPSALVQHPMPVQRASNWTQIPPPPHTIYPLPQQYPPRYHIPPQQRLPVMMPGYNGMPPPPIVI